MMSPWFYWNYNNSSRSICTILSFLWEIRNLELIRFRWHMRLPSLHMVAWCDRQFRCSAKLTKSENSALLFSLVDNVSRLSGSIIVWIHMNAYFNRCYLSQIQNTIGVCSMIWFCKFALKICKLIRLKYGICVPWWWIFGHLIKINLVVIFRAPEIHD